VTRFGQRDPMARLGRLVAGTRVAPPGRPRRTSVVGHRGAPRDQPENTIPSFAYAIEQGADAVETDICVTKDDRFVLWHDNRPGDSVSLARGVGAEDQAYDANWPGALDGLR
jgi:glycerophosphoryl diester phosphodiesterase